MKNPLISYRESHPENVVWSPEVGWHDGTFVVLDSRTGVIDDELTYAAAVELVNAECDRYEDDGWTSDRSWASADNLYAAKLTTRDGGHDYERFLSVERDDS